MGKIVFVLPTYCEAETLPAVLTRFHEAVPEGDVLVVDDASPDGTGEWAAAFRSTKPWVHIIHRPSKGGLASAYVMGFNWAIERGYEIVGQMDADGSHRPEEIPRLLGRLRHLDNPAGVIGARWVPGGSVPGWKKSRIFLSRLGNLYVQQVLRLGIKDATSGFRVYRAQALQKSGVLALIDSSGYAFQAEMTYRLTRKGFTLTETPISFSARQAGRSKMSMNIVVEELCQVTRWGWETFLANLFNLDGN